MITDRTVPTHSDSGGVPPSAAPGAVAPRGAATERTALVAGADPRAGGPLRRLLQGFAYPFRGFRALFRHGRLLTFAILPSLIALVLLVILFVVLVGYADDLTQLIWAKPEEWYLQILWYPLLALVFALSFVVGAVTLPGLVAAPLLDALSERTEAIYLESVDEKLKLSTLARDTGRVLIEEVVKIAILLGGHAVLLLLLLIPVVGAVVYPVVSWLWTVVWLAVDKLHIPMSRRRYDLDLLLGLVRSNMSLAIGFGAAVFLILMVPVLNFMFEPVGVVGGTLLYTDLRKVGALPPPPGEAAGAPAPS